MKSAIRNLLFLSVFLFSVSYDSCVTGVDYDTKHRLYSECSYSGCFGVCGYGYRWMRVGFASFGGGSVIIITMLYVFIRKEREQKLPSILIKGDRELKI